MERDGAALVRAFMELEQLMDSDTTVTELDVDALLLKHRSRSDMFFDTSFGTIAGYGPPRRHCTLQCRRGFERHTAQKLAAAG